MTEFDKVCDFQNLLKAHKRARLGKRDTKDVILFEMNLSSNLIMLSDSLRKGTYKISGYYSFFVHDPKTREIHALRYVDRVVQHCLCDEVLAPKLEPRLIYDNAACRIGKGTHFALQRVSDFLNSFYKRFGEQGYFLKCDIRKFFDNIDHDILKRKLAKVFSEPEILELLFHIIDSYHTTNGKGLPLGNQTSQWFAVYYLDGFDRLIKERLRIKYYSRYMDDCVLICNDKNYLKDCLNKMRNYLQDELLLEFNEKTQIFPIRSGVNYLGWHIYLTDNGKIIRKVVSGTKKKYKKRLKCLQKKYSERELSLDEVKTVLSSYSAHLSHGNTYRLIAKQMEEFVLVHI